jgi:hypothetical protein
MIVRALALLLASSAAVAQVTTSQYDNLRTGATLAETRLTPANVNAAHFGKIGAFKVDGAVYAQPLIATVGKRDVLFVATEHDSVYAFDAANPAAPPLWHVSFLDGQTSTVSARDLHCPFIRPEVGITSTPVIDPSSSTIYVLARTARAGRYFQHLHALDLATGAEKFGGPRLITAAMPGKGEGAVGGQVVFDALLENPRAALMLVNGQVIAAWGSSCDVDPYHGWIMAFDAKTLKRTALFNVTPDGDEGGVWLSDAGFGADAAGNLFVPTANGTFDAATGGRDYGDTILKLSPSLEVLDSYTPADQERLSRNDLDVGSSGPLLLPDRHLLLQPTKGGSIYVIDRDRMGKIVQTLSMKDGGYGAMAYWRGHVYFACSDDVLRDYAVAGGAVQLHAASQEPKFDNPGASPTVSADGEKNAIVWAVATKTWNGPDRAAILYAFDARDIARPIYTSEQNAARDRAAAATRFVIPVVAKGCVYFGTRSEVEMYGLLR